MACPRRHSSPSRPPFQARRVGRGRAPCMRPPWEGAPRTEPAAVLRRPAPEQLFTGKCRRQRDSQTPPARAYRRTSMAQARALSAFQAHLWYDHAPPSARGHEPACFAGTWKLVAPLYGVPSRLDEGRHQRSAMARDMREMVDDDDDACPEGQTWKEDCSKRLADGTCPVTCQ